MIAVIFGSLKGNRAIKLVMFQVALPNDTLPDSAHWRLPNHKGELEQEGHKE